ncbi:TRAP transporter substrate-binding protein [Reyranella sp.]|uniref:TRAP transporter substrate-binding protein n=1 Tax=Reyranella sp. TaxID=1929291 RepID=UPI0025F8434E|nr:TRAP transporter substrate-binding protein [Reyranella sp.]
MLFPRSIAVASSLALGLALLTGPAAAQQPIKLQVAGNLLATGLIQKNKEQPFFEQLAKSTGLPIEVDYKPMDTTGIKDIEGLRVLRNGLFDIVTLRIAQVSRDEPFLLGLDLVGLNPDYATARKVTDAYRAAVDQRLKERYNAKLLGLWPFGPQVIFCKPQIGGLKDLKGKKVRVYDQSLAKFIERIGGIPVTISFGETQQALSLGVVDCAITGPSSANSAGWPEVSEYFMPIGFQIAFNAYAINLKSWAKFDAQQQAKLMAAFKKLEDDIWAYSQELFDDAVRCNVGKDPCTTVKKYSMKQVPVSAADLALVKEAIASVSLPAFAEVCDKSFAGCSAEWKRLLGPVTGIK